MRGARRTVSYVVSFVALALVLGVCMGAYALTRPPSEVVASGSPAGSSGASGSPQPTAAASLAPDDLRVFALGAIAPEHRFVFAGENGKEKLMLVEPEAGQVIEAARFEGLGSFTTGRGGDIAGTADGKTVVIMLDGQTQARVYLIHPIDGAVTSYKLAPSDTPRISPDGGRLAYARSDGVWLMNVASGSEQRVVVGSGVAPKPATWSADGRWLALSNVGGTSIGLFDTQTSVTTVIGPGVGARWRGNELFYWSGSKLSAYDVTARASRVVLDTGGATIGRAEPRPSSAEVAEIEAPQGGNPVLWLRNGPNDRALRGADNVIALWWSVDGSKLYVWDSVGATTKVSDAFTGKTAVTFCLRGSIAPPCQ